MQWWNDIVDWFYSNDGQTLITSTILPFLAILFAGLLAGLIARGAVRRLMAQQDLQHKAAAVASLISAGRRASRWSSLSAQEKEHVDFQVSEAEVKVRMLPLVGADLAAEWGRHQLAEMKRNSVSYSFQAEQDLQDFENGLIAWQQKPSRARKLFAQDLAAWRYEDANPTVAADRDLKDRQIDWIADKDAPTTADAAPAAETAVLPKNGLANSKA